MVFIIIDLAKVYLDPGDYGTGYIFTLGKAKQRRVAVRKKLL